MKHVLDVKIDLLQYARKHDVDPEVLVQGLAETLATVAHTLDRNGFQCHIDDRLATFADHVKADYERLQRAPVTGETLRKLAMVS